MICFPDESNLVAPEDACPHCGQRDIGQLVWLGEDGEVVRCSTCGHRYPPPSSPGQQRPSKEGGDGDADPTR